MSTTPNQDLLRYAQTESVLQTSRSTLAELEQTEAEMVKLARVGA